MGTAMAHDTVSTGVMGISITFHEPVAWEGWLLYHHESTQVGRGMTYVRGQVFTEQGRLIASFTQDGMIRAFVADGADRPVRCRRGSEPGRTRWRLGPSVRARRCPPLQSGGILTDVEGSTGGRPPQGPTAGPGPGGLGR